MDGQPGRRARFTGSLVGVLAVIAMLAGAGPEAFAQGGGLLPGQEAELVRLAQAGGRVVLGPGTFQIQGSLVLPASAELVGAGRDTTVLRVFGRSAEVPAALVAMPGTDVSMSDMTIQYAGTEYADVVLAEADSLRLSRVKVEGATGVGVRFAAGTVGGVFESLVRFNEEAGIVVTHSAHAELRGNTVITNGLGIVVNVDATATLTGNEVTGNAHFGVELYGSGAVLVDSNTVSGNGWSGIIVGLLSQAELTGNTLEGNGQDGIHVRQGATVVAVGNTARRNGQSGLALTGDSIGEFTDNLSEHNAGHGLFATHQASPVAEQNTFRNNNWHGAFVTGSAGGRLERNDFVDNGFSGVLCGDAAATVLVGNRLAGNGHHGFAMHEGATCQEAGSEFEGNVLSDRSLFDPGSTR